VTDERQTPGQCLQQFALLVEEHELNVSRLTSKAARAAIEALREPTGKMLDAAYFEVRGQSAAGVWSAMIDAALAP
jgi:hypothetical protein